MAYELADFWAELRPEPDPVLPEKRDCCRCGEEANPQAEWDTRALVLTDRGAYCLRCFNRWFNGWVNGRRIPHANGEVYGANCPRCNHLHQGDRAIVVSADDHAFCYNCFSGSTESVRISPRKD